MTSHGYSVTRIALDDLYATPKINPSIIKHRLAAVESNLRQFREFVPWPALIDSFVKDQKKLETILTGDQHVTHA